MMESRAVQPQTLVAVCACTFKRPDGLKALLEGLERQTYGAVPPPDVRVVIADNEGSEIARALCADFEKRSSTSLTYVHEPERGIPYARNACLDNLPLNCDFFAFIDDDEVPKEDWLDQLLLAQRLADADAVAGRVVPVFEEGTPAWIVEGGFFGAPRRTTGLDMPEVENLQHLNRAATNNVLVRAAAIGGPGLRFEVHCAFSGGEDTLFFCTLHKNGGRIVFADRAIVYDHIPASRAALPYMLRDRFRVANNNVLIDALVEGRRRPALTRALDGVKHLGLGVRRAIKTALSRKRAADRLAVAAFHMAYGLGVITAALGYRHQHYK
jgi:glycosyltransferase involved in cell wall biosynthesis